MITTTGIGIFVLRMGMIFMAMKYLNRGVNKSPVEPPCSSLPSAATREVTSGTKAVRIVTYVY